MTARDRTDQHRGRLAARARCLNDAVPVQHRVHREGADAEDVVPADEQHGPEHRLRRSTQSLGELPHGVAAVGTAALEKLAGPPRPDVEFEIERFRAQLARALAGEGDPPRLEFRTDAPQRY